MANEGPARTMCPRCQRPIATCECQPTTSSAAPEQDEIAAVAYWSEHIRPTLGGLPIPGLRHLRDRYILDMQDNPEALAQLREWWRTYGAMGGNHA